MLGLVTKQVEEQPTRDVTITWNKNSSTKRPTGICKYEDQANLSKNSWLKMEYIKIK